MRRLENQTASAPGFRELLPAYLYRKLDLFRATHNRDIDCRVGQRTLNARSEFFSGANGQIVNLDYDVSVFKAGQIGGAALKNLPQAHAMKLCALNFDALSIARLIT